MVGNKHGLTVPSVGNKDGLAGPFDTTVTCSATGCGDLHTQRDALQRQLGDERARVHTMVDQQMNAIMLEATGIWRSAFNEMTEERKAKVERAQAAQRSERQAANRALSELTASSARRPRPTSRARACEAKPLSAQGGSARNTSACSTS